MFDQLIAVTLQQPWAWAIAWSTKRLENRSWTPGPHMMGRQIAIHAGKTIDERGARWMHRHGLLSVPFPPAAHVRGAIVAVATYDHAVTQSDDPWFFGPVGWSLRDVIALPSPVPCRGALGLWRVPEDVQIEVLSQLPIGDRPESIDTKGMMG